MCVWKAGDGWRELQMNKGILSLCTVYCMIFKQHKFSCVRIYMVRNDINILYLGVFQFKLHPTTINKANAKKDTSNTKSSSRDRLTY